MGCCDDHFKGKTAPEHLKEARFKTAKDIEPSHAIEAPGAKIAFADSAKAWQLSFCLYGLGFQVVPIS